VEDEELVKILANVPEPDLGINHIPCRTRGSVRIFPPNLEVKPLSDEEVSMIMEAIEEMIQENENNKITKEVVDS
jgi:hypothetical protein